MKKVMIVFAFFLPSMHAFSEICATNISKDPASLLAICIPEHHSGGCPSDPIEWPDQINDQEGNNRKCINDKPTKVLVSFTLLGIGYSAVQEFTPKDGQAIELKDYPDAVIPHKSLDTIDVTLVDAPWCKKAEPQAKSSYCVLQ